ncbi:MAG: hypothetical protein LPK45_09540 [Bacteroidota bacterium]|nr:hypothetical protein [Bacteroidota bacterium]MDX5431327.1 hypothetical protein [Bacteroidota bacterium]MDX5470065.1 hypothetical protein [Bacteroidota bacterium]
MLHKFYVSHYTLDYRDKEIQVTAKLFADYLETVFAKSNSGLRIDEKSNRKQLDSLIKTYFKQHLRLSIDYINAEFTYLGYELEQDIIYVYLKTPSPKQPEHLSFYCDVLTDEFEDQVNLFKVSCGLLKETFFLNAKDKLKVVQI